MLDAKLLEAFFDNIDIVPNSSVLDVGCQSAYALTWIKEKYDIKGELIGIDKRSNDFEDEETLRELGVSLLLMNASETMNFPNDSFDLIFHCNTLECITDIDAHILDLHRVLRKDGIIVCVHRDWESIVFNGKNKDLINKAIYGYANFLQASWMDACDGWIGRRVWGYFNKTGLFNGNISIHNSIETEFTESAGGWHYIHDMHHFIEPKGFLTEEEYEELIDDMEETYTKGEYLCVSPYYVFAGRKK